MSEFDLLSGTENKVSEERLSELKNKIENRKKGGFMDLFTKTEQKIDETLQTSIKDALADSQFTEEKAKQLGIEIAEANFETLEDDRSNMEKDLQDMMIGLREMLDGFGGGFAKLQELNEDETGMIDEAKEQLADFESKLNAAKGMPGIANVLFGMKNRRTKKFSEKVEEAQANIKEVEQKAERMYRERLRDATIEESLNRIISQVSGMIDMINEEVANVDQNIAGLENRKQIIAETKERASKMMEEKEKALEEAEAAVRAAQDDLVNFQNGTEEYAKQENHIADLQNKRADIKAEYQLALGVFHSKERFFEQVITHIEAQKTTRANLKTLSAQLRSDTDERIEVYRSTLQLLQSAITQEAASIYEEAGVKTDALTQTIASKILVASEKDRIIRTEKQEERMKNISTIIINLAKQVQSFKEKDEQLRKEFKEKYGIDKSEQFEHTYESEALEGDNSSSKDAAEDLLS